MSRIKAGMVCLIVGEVKGCESNIGAQVTVTEWAIQDDIKLWMFKDASRPLDMVGDSSARDVRASTEHPGYPWHCWVLLDRHLVPVLPPEQDEAAHTSQDLELTA